MFTCDTYIKNINGKWYAFAGDTIRNQVYSIGSDNPYGGGRWFARWTDEGIKYVASACMSRNGAYKRARRHGKYCGEV